MRYQRSVWWWTLAATFLVSGCHGEITVVCTPGDYPDAPEGAAAVLHVSNECPADEEDGSAKRPYQTIEAALAKAPAGAAVLVAPGIYAEHVKIEGDVALVGSSDPTRPDLAGAVIAPSDAPFTSCSGQPTTASVFVCGEHRATIRGLRVTGASAAGIAVKTGTLVVEGSVVEDIATEDGKFGYGVLAAEGATLTLRDSVVTGAAAVGVLVREARASLKQNEIRDNLGTGVWLSGALEKVEIADNAIEANAQFGVAVVGSSAILSQNIISGTTENEREAGSGHGLIASELLPQDGASATPYGLELIGNELTGNASAGVVLARTTLGFIVRDNRISDNAMSGALGGGILLPQGVDAGAGNTIEGNTIEGNRFLGIGIAGDTSTVLIRRNVIERTVVGRLFDNMTRSISIGDGISLSARASARLLDNVVRNNERVGLIVNAADGADTFVDGNVFENNGSFGVVVQDQPIPPSISNNVYRDNGRGDMASGSTEKFDVWRGDVSL